MAVSLGEDSDSRHDDALDRAESPDAPPRILRPAVAVGVVASTVYVATLSAVPAITHDSMTYLLAIQNGGDALFHPHHLAYNALSRAWVDLLSAVGLGNDPIRSVAALNALLGGCAVALVWVLLRVRAGVSGQVALAGTCGVGLSFGVWFYSVSVEVYLLPLVLLLATMLVLTSDPLTPRLVVLVGVLNGLAVVAHQVNILFALVVVTVLVRDADRVTSVRRLARYGAAACGVVVAAYGAVLACAVRPSSTGEAADWFTRYAQSDSYWSFGPTAPIEAATGLVRALVGGHFSFRLTSVRDMYASLFEGRSLDDEAFLVRHLPAWLAVALLVVAALGGVLLITALVRGVRNRRAVPASARRLLRPLVAWLIAYSAFFLVWEPVNLEFWIPQVTAIWMIAAVLTDRHRPAATDPLPRPWLGPALLGCAALAIGSANLVGTVVPAMHADNDIYGVRYRHLGASVSAGDIAVVDTSHLGVGYTTLYTEAEPMVVDDYMFAVETDELSAPSPDEIAARVERAVQAGHRVAIDQNLVDNPGSDDAEAAGVALAERFEDRWHHIDVPDAAGWYLLDPATDL